LIFDTGATAHIVNDASIVTNVRNIDAVKIMSAGGPIAATLAGDLKHIGPTLIVPEMPVNLISLNALQKCGMTIHYEDNNFKVLKDGVTLLTFAKGKDGLFTCPVKNLAFSTVILTKEHRQRATEARELSRRLAYPGDEALKKLLDRGSLTGCRLTGKDVDNARELFGEDPDAYAGKATASAATPDQKIKSSVVGETLHTDIFYLTFKGVTKPFLITVDEASNYVISVALAQKSKDHIGRALTGIANWYKARGHKVAKIVSDSESNFGSAQPNLEENGIQLEQRPPDTHARLAERYIRVIKERARATYHASKLESPPIAIGVQLVSYVVHRINMLPNIKTNSQTPYELVHGRKIDYVHDLPVKFGDVGLFRKPKGGIANDMEPRTEWGIVVNVVPGHNRCVRVWIPTSGSIVTRSTFKIFKGANLPSIFQQINATPSVEPTLSKEEWHQEGPKDTTKEPEVVDLTTEDEEIVDLTNDVPTALQLTISEALAGPAAVNCRKAIEKELANMIKYKVWTHVDPNLVTGRIIPSKMFLKEKSNGTWKARIVAGGHRQLYDGQTSSPTAHLPSTIIVLQIATSMGLEIFSADVPAAYLNADIDKAEYMRIDRSVADLIPGDIDGSSVVRLNKSIYGLKQSGRLWNKAISCALQNIGFVPSVKDPCLLTSRKGNEFIILTLHVDDILWTGNWSEGKNKLASLLKDKYQVEVINKDNREGY
jgi:hypothetical protein